MDRTGKYWNWLQRTAREFIGSAVGLFNHKLKNSNSNCLIDRRHLCRFGFYSTYFPDITSFFFTKRGRSLIFTICLYLHVSSHKTLLTLLITAVCRTHVITNQVNMTQFVTSLPVAQRLERPTGVQEVMGLIPVGTQIFLFLFSFCFEKSFQYKPYIKQGFKEYPPHIN